MLLGLNRVAMAGKKLPYDAEVEYLQSDGNQHIILTGVWPKYHKVGLKQIGTATPYYLYAYIGTNNDGSRSASIYSDSLGTLKFVNYDRESLSCTVDVSTFHDINATGGKVIVDGEEIGSLTMLSIDTGGALGMCLFGLSRTSTAVGRSQCAISYYIGLDASGNELVNLIPIRKNVDGVNTGFMYDTISGDIVPTTGTAFTGSLIGPDKT